MAMVLVRALVACPGLANLCLYSQRRSPLVALMAWMAAPGTTTYITPLRTSGMVSVAPAAKPRVHARANWPAFCRLIWLSGLKRCASYVRLYMSQSFGLGF